MLINIQGEKWHTNVTYVILLTLKFRIKIKTLCMNLLKFDNCTMPIYTGADCQQWNRSRQMHALCQTMGV